MNKRTIKRLSSVAGSASIAALADGLLHAVKLPVCLMAAMSSVFGHVLFLSRLDGGALTVFLGVFLLATGGCCLNILQEREADIRYGRTRDRTLSISVLSPLLLLFFACLCSGSGIVLLGYTGQGPLPPILGLVSLLVYNGVYTPLKKVSGFALIPGGIAGALPPVIGWTAAGGGIFDPLPVLLFVLFFLWQIPHFCLLLLTHLDDYRKQGIYRNLATSLSVKGIRRITGVWLLSLGTCLLFLTVIPDLMPVPAKVIIALTTALFLAAVLSALLYKTAVSPRKLFIFLNGYFFFSLVVVATGAMTI